MTGGFLFSTVAVINSSRVLMHIFYRKKRTSGLVDSHSSQTHYSIIVCLCSSMQYVLVRTILELISHDLNQCSYIIIVNTQYSNIRYSYQRSEVLYMIDIYDMFGVQYIRQTIRQQVQQG